MSRNELPEKSPEGIDDQTWFYLHATLRKFDSAITRLEKSAGAVSSAEEGAFTPPRANGFCAGLPGDMVSTGSVDYGVLSWGSTGSGHVQADSAGYPTGTVSAAYQSRSLGYYSPGNLIKDLTTTVTFGTPAGTLVGDNVFFINYTEMPFGSSGWLSDGIRVFYGHAFTGISDGDTVAVELFITDGTSSVTATKVHTAAGGVGTTVAYGAGVLTLTSQDLAAITWVPGVPVGARVGWSSDATASSSGTAATVGAMELNWK